jgi:hypothetical protein
MSTPRRLWQAPSVLLINVAVFCVIAESLGLLAFYYQHGWLFYLDPYKPTFSAIVEGRDDAALTAVGLHPYFGPTHRPGIPFDVPPELQEPGPSLPPIATNNVGFPSPYDYPYLKTGPDDYVIGVFGGSVGAWFCRLGSARLVDGLSRQAAFRGKRIVPLCFSHEGYKQPQQLLVLAYFLSIGQTFDLVVNIDGFNEVALSPINEEHGFDASMPSAGHMEPLVNLVNQATLTPEKLDSLGEMRRLRRRLATLASWLNGTRFASAFVVLERLHQSAEREYVAERVRFNQLPSNPPAGSVIHVTPPMASRRGDALFGRVASDWATASSMMHALLVPRGIGYLHVLQPNQYYTRRRFGPEEGRVALLAESPFKTSVERGYPLLQAALQSAAFTGTGVHVIDGTRLFDDEPRAVYVDNCCHYTRLGNRLMADLIARAVAAVTSGTPR